MANTTYSFKDVICTISCSLVGQKVITGEGIGSIKISYTDDNTASDIAANGDVMTSRIESDRGAISIELQQTSSDNVWLTNWFNALRNAESSAWASTSITLVEKFANGLKYVATGVSPKKRPDHNDQQQGQKVTWELESQSVQQTAA